MFYFKQDGQRLTLSEIDKIAAEFWKQPFDSNYYSSPKGLNIGPSWYDVIGTSMIVAQRLIQSENNQVDSIAVKRALLSGYICTRSKNRAIESMKYYWPYIELIDKLDSLNIEFYSNGIIE